MFIQDPKIPFSLKSSYLTCNTVTDSNVDKSHSRFHDKVVIEEELNEVRNELPQVWENTKYHLKLAKRTPSLYNMDVMTIADSLHTVNDK